MVEEIWSSMGESGTRHSQSFTSDIIRNVMNKYHLSYNEARDFISRARSQGARNEGDYYNLARRQSNKKKQGGI
jgi:hypothetical protein